jgi:CBS-domain-containing membrane protein
VTTVAEVMNREIVAVGPATSFEALLVTLGRERASNLVYVVDEAQRLLGIISSYDILQAMTQRRGLGLFSRLAVDPSKAVDMNCARTAADLMVGGVVSVREDDDYIRAVELIVERRVQALPVVDARGRAVGEVTRRGLIRQTVSLNWQRLVERGAAVRDMSGDGDCR